MSHRRIISLHFARQFLNSIVRPVESERIQSVQALSRIAAEDVRFARSLPETDQAAVEGWAVVAADTLFASTSTPVTLGVASETYTLAKGAMVSGTAVYVQAKDNLPAGANAVVPKANSFRESSSPGVLILSAVSRGDGVLETGSLQKKGSVRIQKGSFITAELVGTLGYIGEQEITVSAKPKVCVIFSTSDAHGPTVIGLNMWLQAELGNMGCLLSRFECAAPGRIPVTELLANDCDNSLQLVILDSGQPADPIVRALGDTGEVYFERVQMQPAGPLTCAVIKGVPVLACSLSNLRSVMETLLWPAVCEMSGCTDTGRSLITAVSSAAISISPGNAKLVWANLHYQQDKVHADPLEDTLPWLTDRRPDGYILLTEYAQNVRRGESVDFVLIRR